MASKTHTLYHHEYSICSIMVRFTLACGISSKSDSAFQVEERVVNIFNEEQLTEDFLCNINGKGQVPVLTSSNLSAPIADSLEITHYLAKFFPSLIPSKYSSQITSLLAELHSLNYFSLSFPGREGVSSKLLSTVERAMQQDISEKHRKALEYKLEVVKTDKIGGLKPEVTADMSKRAGALMEQLETFLPAQGTTQEGGNGPWLFGLESPSALDAHLVTFVQRMRDVGRQHLIPKRLEEYVDNAVLIPEWKKVMNGRKTMIG